MKIHSQGASVNGEPRALVDPAPTRVQSKGMKLLVIILRGLQAAACGPYGNRLVETFTLDALAAQGVVFDTHLAVHPAVAHRVWRTGCHHFPLSAGSDPPAGPWPDLLAALHARGVATRLIVDTSRPSPAEWAAGWQQVQSEPDTASAVTAAEETLQDLADTPSWLVWLELASLLPPWDLDEDVLRLQFAAPAEEEDEDEEEEDV